MKVSSTRTNMGEKDMFNCSRQELRDKKKGRGEERSTKDVVGELHTWPHLGDLFLLRGCRVRQEAEKGKDVFQKYTLQSFSPWLKPC